VGLRLPAYRLQRRVKAEGRGASGTVGRAWPRRAVWPGAGSAEPRRVKPRNPFLNSGEAPPPPAIYRLSSRVKVGSGYRVPATVAVRPLLSMDQCRRPSLKAHDSTKALAACRNFTRPRNQKFRMALESPRLPSALCWLRLPPSAQGL
jgi:hypothetical protein